MLLFKRPKRYIRVAPRRIFVLSSSRQPGKHGWARALERWRPALSSTLVRYTAENKRAASKPSRSARQENGGAQKGLEL